jgi:GTPase
MSEKSNDIEKPNDEIDLIDASRLDWFDQKQLSVLKALLVGVYKGDAEEKLAEEHLQELKQLAETYGILVIDEICMSLRTFTASTFLSQGKLSELKEAVEKLGAELVVFDDDISPAQQRNLENFLRVPVIDRAEVILGVFAQRARTKEAKLQIELAQVKYIAPRLKRMWTHFSKQHGGGGGGGGGGGYLKGEGEKQIELDRRMLRKRQDDLKAKIADVSHYRATQRGLRERNEIPIFAIVGYTNAGKSTLMKALTNADVFIEDKLFATLDTTTRKFMLPDNQEVLLIDTVGFIRKLPHLLVMSFRSTLEEAVQADILIHMIDASNPSALHQAETTLQVLNELKAGDKPVITLLNKIDILQSDLVEHHLSEVGQRLKLAYPRSIEFSATTGLGLNKLISEMQLVLKERRARLMLRIPQSDYHKVSEAIREGKVFSTEYEENDVIIDVELPRILANRFDKYKI